jgi:hypothetical protein
MNIQIGFYTEKYSQWYNQISINNCNISLENIEVDKKIKTTQFQSENIFINMLDNDIHRRFSFVVFFTLPFFLVFYMLLIFEAVGSFLSFLSSLCQYKIPL